MNLPSFIAGVLVGIISCGVFVLTLIAKRASGVTKNARRGYQPLPRRSMPPPPMPRVKREDATLWDVGEQAEREQPLYMYGIGAELEE
jgi:hypothetical protein